VPPKAKTLRAVTADEVPPEPAKPLTLDQAIEGGNYLEILRAQRREIAAALPNEKGPALAALHRQLSLLAKEISQLEAKSKQEADEDGGTVEDEAWNSEAL
jgi:hypothetical protein